MPVSYEYRCQECGNVFTVRRNVDERNDPASCVCDGEALRRLTSNPINMGKPYINFPKGSV